MKWDIDKALAALTTTGDQLGTSLTPVVHSDLATLKGTGIPVSAQDREKGYVVLWCLSLGHVNGRKLFTYGRTIREAYLRARKVVRSLPAESLQEYVLKEIKRQGKRNSFASARRKRK
jgi:hypothetical protein